ncbi:MAG: tetratricopeptide repeat protein [Candidatus Rifleibacteriota bacterium]
MSLINQSGPIKVVLFLLLFCCSSLLAQNLIPELLGQGLQLYSAKDYRGAADYLGQVVDMQPEHNQARYYLVFSLSMSGQHEASLKHARYLAKKFPQQKQYASLVKQLKKTLTDQQKKKANKQQAHNIPDEVVFGGYESRATEVREAKMATAPRDLKPARELTPLEKAIRMIDEDHYASATASLENILQKEPDNAMALQYRGVIEFNSGDYQNAKKWFKKAIKADPKMFQTHFLLGDCYRAELDYEKAAEEFQKALEIKKDVFAQLNLADCFMEMQEFKKAEKIFTEIIDKDKNISEALLGMAQIKLYNGYVNEAMQKVNEVLTVEPQSAQAHYLKARILMENELNKDAVEEAKIALNNYPDNLQYKTLYALALVRSYQTAKGLDEASQIIKQNPDFVPARLAIAEGLIMSGAYADAEEHLREVSKNAPHPQVFKLRAIKAVKNAEYEKADEFYKKYIELAQGQPKAYMDYAAFLETSQNFTDALKAYQEIAEMFKKTAYAEVASRKVEQLESKLSAESDSGQGNTSSEYRKGKVKY